MFSCVVSVFKIYDCFVCVEESKAEGARVEYKVQTEFEFEVR